MGLFNRNQSKKSADKKSKAASETDVISSLLSEATDAESSKGVTLGYDEELDAGLEKFRKAQANPSDEDQFAKAMAGERMSSKGASTFNFGEPDSPLGASSSLESSLSDFDGIPLDDSDHYGAEPYGDAPYISEQYGNEQYASEPYTHDAAPYFIEDHRNPYTQASRPAMQGDLPETLPSVTKGELASPQRARLSSHKPVPPERSTKASEPSAAAKSAQTAQNSAKSKQIKDPMTADQTSNTRATQHFKSLQPKQPVSETRYGIADAIKLLRQLPETGDVTILMTIVKRTLETAGIRISDIIDDAQKHRQHIQGRVQQLETEIGKLQAQMQARTTEINNLTAQLTETEQVQELLELAEMPAPTQFELEAPETEHKGVEIDNAKTNLIPDDQLVD